MELFQESRQGLSCSQVPPTSFPLPHIIDSSGVVVERNAFQHTANTTKDEAAQHAETWSLSSQRLYTSAKEHSQRPAHQSDDGVNNLITSANQSSSSLLQTQVNTQLPVNPFYPFPAATAAEATAVAVTTAFSESTAPATAPVELRGRLPVRAAATAQPLSVQPCSCSSIASDSVLSPVEAAAAGAWTHALVVFDKLFCVCFVPPTLRPVRAGELVLCEFGASDNIATVVADVSSLVARVIGDRDGTERTFGFNSPTSPATGATYRNASPLYREKLTSGLASDHLLCRLPSIIRRGTNRDKKRLYFSKLRSNDALAVAQHELLTHPVTAQAAEYQVNFACAVIYLAGDRSQCMLPDQQFANIGEALLEKLRCETVEFRFWTERNHGELDLTRAVLGLQYSEMMFAKVLDHLRSQSSRSAQRAAAQASGTRQQPATATLPQQAQPPQQQHLVGILSSAIKRAPSYADSQKWSHAAATPAMTSVQTVAFLQQTSPSHPRSMSYAVGPSLCMAPHAAAPVLPPSPPSLSFVQSSPYETLHHVSRPPVTYVTTQHTTSPYYGSPPQPQQHQATITLSAGPVSSSPVYYVMPSSAAVQWDRSSTTAQRGAEPHLQQQQHYLQRITSPHAPVQAHITPTLFRGVDSTVTQQTLHSSTQYVQSPTVTQQGYQQAVTYPVLFSPNGTHYQQF